MHLENIKEGKMKTLDEVINSMEACVHEKCYYESDCAYSYLAFGEISCVTKAIPAMMTDALQYLKQFRDYQNSAEMKINPACVSGVENEPLSWDELKQMKGKPVLVEADEGKYKVSPMKRSAKILATSAIMKLPVTPAR